MTLVIVNQGEGLALEALLNKACGGCGDYVGPVCYHTGAKEEIMDPATIGFIGVIVVSLTGNMVQLVIGGNKPAPLNGSLTSMIDSRIAFHALKCPNLDTILDTLTEMRGDMKDHLREHREAAEHDREQWQILMTPK